MSHNQQTIKDENRKGKEINDFHKFIPAPVSK
jgi:hypothetical protein